jgi:hypothetical protein
MIIFDLDDCLANCDHRKHLLDPNSYPEVCEYSNYRLVNGDPVIDLDGKASWRYKSTGEPFVDGLNPFNEACENDDPIQWTIDVLNELSDSSDIEIWTGRCVSVREKTENWLTKYLNCSFFPELKMRPIGNIMKDHELKSNWLNESLSKGIKIHSVFDSHKKSISMWRSRGVFVFNCIKPKW